MMKSANPTGLLGIEFVEFATPEPRKLEDLFLQFGFSMLMKHKIYNYLLFQQGRINFVLNKELRTLGNQFAERHGPSISAMGWRVKNAKVAYQAAIDRGATVCPAGDYFDFKTGENIPAIYGIGRSIIYFIDDSFGDGTYDVLGFSSLQNPVHVPDKGFVCIDHLTNNVEKGEMKRWADFYREIFGFKEVRYFDIRGVKTGLQSYALRSPCGTFCIPINEGTEDKSQINEYLREYRGPGIQHLAFLTHDIISSVEKIRNTSIQTLDIDDEYYDSVFERVPHVKEDHARIKDLNILVDGDEDGYLLQIFTKNLVGPIFVEIIQRNNHLSFGEGNFGALFRSIERDQEARGVI